MKMHLPLLDQRVSELNGVYITTSCITEDNISSRSRKRWTTVKIEVSVQNKKFKVKETSDNVTEAVIRAGNTMLHRLKSLK